MTSTIRGASLAFEAARIDIPLDDLLEKAGTEGVGLSAPKISPPTASVADVDVDKLSDLALAEILSHARSGTARVHLPLRPTTMKRGPFSVAIPEGAEVVIDLEVDEDVIRRQETRGYIVPALKLPLGVEVRGVYLDDEGNIIADLANFPDLNLSWLALNGLQVPASLREILDLVFEERDTRLIRRRPPDPSESFDGRIVVVKEDMSTSGVVKGADDIRSTEGTKQEANGDATQAVDLDRLRVVARGILPHLTPLSLGKAGTLTPGPNTVFDIDFSMEGATVHGDIELVGGTLDIGGLKVEGLRGRGAFVVRIDGIRDVGGMSIQLDIEHGEIDSASMALKDGTKVEIDNATLDDATIRLGMAEGAISWKVDTKNFSAEVESAEVMMRIGSAVTPVQCGPAHAAGSASASNDHFLVDMEVDGVDLEVDSVAIGLGLAHMDLARVTANATGRVKAGTDFGYTFSGVLAVQGSVDDGHIDAGPLQAKFVDGSEGTLEITQVAASPDGLEALVGRGRLDIRLASGTLPLGTLAALQFSRGAVGRLELDAIRFNAGDRWPHVQGRGNLMARADPVAVKELISLPSGHGHVDLGAFELDHLGHLHLGALRMWVASEDAHDVDDADDIAGSVDDDDTVAMDGFAASGDAVSVQDGTDANADAGADYGVDAGVDSGVDSGDDAQDDSTSDEPSIIV